LSDYQEYSFGLAYGVLIKELKLLSRSIFVLDGDDTTRYIQHVSEITTEPDYVAVLEAAANENQIAIKQVPMDGVCGGYWSMAKGGTS
jgi:thiol peroxidase